MRARGARVQALWGRRCGLPIGLSRHVSPSRAEDLLTVIIAGEAAREASA